MPILSVLK